MVEASEAAAWEAYFYANTRILKNRLDLRDPEQLQQAEQFLVNRRTERLHAGYAQIPHTFDGAHLKAIHHYLFQDVYDWAGEYRTVHIGKRIEAAEPSRWFLPPEGLEVWLTEMGAAVRDIPWRELEREDLVRELSEIHTYLNFAHPWREGSGRTARVYLEHVVEGTPFRLDFERVNAADWNEASRDSIIAGRDRPASGPLIFEPQLAIFEQLVVTRAQPGTATAVARQERIERLRAQRPPQLGAAGLDANLGRQQDLGRGPSLGR